MPQASAGQDVRDKRCPELAQQIITLRADIRTTEDVIRGSRNSDQVAGYLSAVLFPPLALAIDQQRARKDAMDRMQMDIDARIAEQRMLRCPA